MNSGPLLYPMLAHIAWVVLLYVLLTICRAPSVWGVGAKPDGASPWADIEARVSANLSNQFEWPMFFYLACLLAILENQAAEPAIWSLGWVFVIGRIIHSGIQIGTTNVRLRGIVFTINFVAVLLMFGVLVVSGIST